jgi:hypothetical protein
VFVKHCIACSSGNEVPLPKKTRKGGVSVRLKCAASMFSRARAKFCAPTLHST